MSIVYQQKSNAQLQIPSKRSAEVKVKQVRLCMQFESFIYNQALGNHFSTGRQGQKIN